MKVKAFAMGLMLTLASTGCAAPRIAILEEPDFPYYMAAPSDGPRLFQDLYQSMGLQVDMLSAKQLGDPAVFNARKYAAYVHVYGNTFPIDAFANLVQFHKDGGVLIIPSGVPFCHPCTQIGATGWQVGVERGGGRTTTDAHGGAVSFRIHNVVAGGWTGVSGQRMAVKPGEKFTVGGWIKIATALGVHENSRVFMRFYDATGKFIGQDGPSMPTAPCDWTRLEKELVVPEGATTGDVSAQLWAPEGEVLVDDMFLTREGEKQNLVGNPSFEEASGQWGDLGHLQKYMTHEEGIGVGEFIAAENLKGFRVAPFGEKIGLSLTKWDQVAAPGMVQVLDPKTLPAEDEVRPIVTLGDPAKGVSPAVMVVHHCREFNGAIDVWGRGNCPAIQGPALYEIVAKATVAALREKGAVTVAEAKTMDEKADVPLREARRQAMPVTEKRPFDTVWPHSKHPAETVAVCDVSGVGPEMEFRLTVLQGLVNRELPRLYLIHANYARQDKQWLDELKIEGIKTEDISPDEVWKRFGGVAKGVVVYDRAALKEIGAFHADKLNITNLVMMLCAVNDAVPQGEDAGAVLDRVGLPVIVDTRGKWATPYEMYKWSYDNLWAKMNHHVLATLYPGIYYLTDYLVENKVFTFWFGSQRTFREQTLLERVLGSTPPNTPILGWWFDWMPNVQDPAHAAADCIGEGDGVEIGSRYGKFLTVTHEATNLSVHSGMPLLPLKRKPIAAPAKLDRTKVYYSFMISDGDNLGECLMMRCRDLHWDKPERGSAPMGWSFAPATAVLAPTVVNYYLRTATENDLLVGGLGIGYTHPDAYGTAYPEQREAIFKEYARMTAESLRPLDSGVMWLIGGSRANITRYAEAGRPLRTLFPDYGWGTVRPYNEVTYMDAGDVAVFRAVTGWGDNEDYVARLVKDLYRRGGRAPRPAFCHAFLLNWGFRLPQMREVIDKLGPEYVPVRPDELDRLYRESQR